MSSTQTTTTTAGEKGKTKGLLHVTMQPRLGELSSIHQFHEWYNNEHGPTRLRLPQIFPNGLRYRAIDGEEPEFLAIYDVTEMRFLETEIYTDLRANRSEREAGTIGCVDVGRRFFDLLFSSEEEEGEGGGGGDRGGNDGGVGEGKRFEQKEGDVLVCVELAVKGDVNVEEVEKKVVEWYAQEHVEMLRRVQGWRRTRVYRTPSRIEEASSGAKGARIVALHEYDKVNGLGGEAHRLAMGTERRKEVFATYVEEKLRREYELFYIFGPAPRELDALSHLPVEASFVSVDGKITTTAGEHAAIDAYVTTKDGLEIPYRLEGNGKEGAPTVAFCNSLLTSLHMWDPLVAILKEKRPDVRILRYDTRGRHDVPEPAVPATLEMLADDLKTLLAALRIEKLDALVGVSMGGATTLKFALRNPGLVGRFVACDFNVASSDANTAAWKDRIAVAESPEQGIGKLAGVTVERWFHPYTMSDRKAVAEWMTEMVAANSVQGFRFSCQALWNYNMREEMKGCKVSGLFVVGDGDGKGALVKAMDGFKGLLGEAGAELKVVPQAGHLPMCEAPREFWEAIKGFL